MPLPFADYGATGSESRRRRHISRAVALLVAPLLLLTVAASACDDDDADEGGDTTGSATIPGGNQLAGGGAEEYAQDLFAAWEAGDTARIETLANGDAAKTLVDRPFAASDGFEYESCTVADDAFCTWRGAEETLSMLVESELAYQQEDGAVVEVQFGEATDDAPASAGQMPSSSRDYAEAAFDAWQSGDGAMIERLAAPDARVVLESRQWLESDGWELEGCSDAADTGLSCTWKGEDNAELEITVDAEAADLGEEQAVVEAQFRGF